MAVMIFNGFERFAVVVVLASVLALPPIFIATGLIEPALGEQTTVQVQEVTKSKKLPQAASRFAWPGLGQDATIALGEALKKTIPGKKVVVWCATVDCTDLAADLDDAFQIAGVDSDIDRREIDSSDDVGVFVGPPGPDASKLVQALADTTWVRARIVEAPHDAPLALIIGKKPRGALLKP
jgi:hypothetical protein